MSTTQNIYEILQRIKALIEDASEEEHVSELLMWVLVRQQCDYQLHLLEEHPEDLSSGLTD